MKNRRQFDLVVFGAEPSGLAAAACAARTGALCAVITTGLERPANTSISDIPNFVWRQLDLHETDLTVEPVSAFVSLFKDGRKIQTHASDQQTQEVLTKLSASDGALWQDFKSEMQRKRTKTNSLHDEIIGDEGDLEHLMMDGATIESMATVLDDYFEVDELKTHLASVAGLGFGVGGEEPGSAFALASAFGQSSWRIRNAEKLSQTLTLICERLGVEQFTSAVRRIERRDAKSTDIDFELGDDIRARYVMACSSRIVNAANLKTTGDPSPLTNKDAAEAIISVKLSEAPQPPEGVAEGAVYYVAESVDEIRVAREAVLEGRTPDHPPMMFQFGDKEILVRTPYCPRIFVSEDGPREWTGQDRQVLGKQVVERLGQYLNGALQDVQRTDVKLYGAVELEPEHPLNNDTPEIAAPLPDINEIGAAANLALRLVAGD